MLLNSMIVQFMQRLKRVCLVAIVIAASGITVTYAQTIFRARAVGSYNSRGVMHRLHKMSDPAKVSGCDRIILVGTVQSATDNDKNEIVNFSMKIRSGERRTVNLSSALYPQLPIEAEIGLSRLLTQGKRIRVVAYSCEGVGLEADEIRAL